jgi:hypothetical protein
LLKSIGQEVGRLELHDMMEEVIISTTSTTNTTNTTNMTSTTTSISHTQDIPKFAYTSSQPNPHGL